MNIIEE